MALEIEMALDRLTCTVKERKYSPGQWLALFFLFATSIGMGLPLFAFALISTQAFTFSPLPMAEALLCSLPPMALTVLVTFAVLHGLRKTEVNVNQSTLSLNRSSAFGVKSHQVLLHTDVQRIERHGDWPQRIEIVNKDGTVLTIPMEGYELKDSVRLSKQLNTLIGHFMHADSAFPQDQSVPSELQTFIDRAQNPDSMSQASTKRNAGSSTDSTP